MNYLEKVEEFHKAFDYKQPTPTHQDVTDTELQAARYELLREELKELWEAMKNESAVEILDALCDIQYVLSGAVLALGYGKVFDDAFVAVHVNNMDKFWTFEEVGKWADGTQDFKKITNDKFIAYRLFDNKIIKPPHHRKVDLTGFIHEAK